MSRYHAMNGEDSPVVLCDDDEPGVVFAMAGRQQDVELIAAALNLAEAAKTYYREFDHLVGEHDYPERRGLRDALIVFSEANSAALPFRDQSVANDREFGASESVSPPANPPQTNEATE